jgi:hypothetical protein
MEILKEVILELFGMFVADARLSAAILALVAIVAALIGGAHVDPLVAGGVLLAGCLALVLESVRRAAAKSK